MPACQDAWLALSDLMGIESSMRTSRDKTGQHETRQDKTSHYQDAVYGPKASGRRETGSQA
ncbi:hypothetical protein MKX08_007006 [Trichoderma sp. CBMAI-0020]|nr:hypothetical protein MKX08_007006 [Trichoderma sp. CBMAI-0020]